MTSSMKNKKERLVSFRISSREEEMMNALCEYLGSRPGEMLRGLIVTRYTKLFPRYTQTRQEKVAAAAMAVEDLTPEQLCEREGGRVVNRDGVMMCSIPLSSSMNRYIPLSKPELFKKK